MKDYKKVLTKDFWQQHWHWIREKGTPVLQAAVARYRAFEARRPILAKVSLVFGSGFALLLLFLLAILVGIFGKMPSRSDLRNLNQNIASEIYTEDGVLLGKYFIENRLPTELDSISPYLINALVSTEDARFFEHGGVDFKAAMRVLFRTIIAGDESSGGGSTISQQLAKNLYPRKRLGFLTLPVAKLKEIIIARRLEGVYNKEEILALYLNTVPFGENVFGIKIATQRFFSTNPFEIKAEEAAVLIGMLKANTAYNPVRNPQRAKERRNVVLQRMVKYNYLSQQVADSLSRLPVVVRYSTESHNEGMATYFREHLRLELEQELRKYSHPDGRPYNLYTDGLKIYTTLNSKAQQYAELAVKEHMKSLQETFIRHFNGYDDAVPWGSEELVQSQKKATERYKQLKESGLSEAEIDSNFSRPVKMTIFSWDTESQDKDTLMSPVDSLKYYLSMLNTGFLAADPHTGKIMAWVGGINFKHFKFDHVKALRQVGSTFKPVVYAKAIDHGIQPCERFPNDFITYPEFDNWAPRNVDGVYGGSYSMRGGLRMSVNTVAVQLILKVGIDSVRMLARQMGISSDMPLEPGIALGSVDATLFEMVRLYSVFANHGTLPQLHALKRIETADGKAIAEFESPDPVTFPQVLKPQTADMVRYMLQSVIDGGTGGRLRYITDFRYPAAGKTGTTDNNSDGWFLCFTPDIVTGTWIGAEQPLVRWRSTRLGQGGVSALPISGKFLTAIYADSLFKDWRYHNFPELTGMPSGSFGCADFIPGYESLLDSISYYEMLPVDSISEEERQLRIQSIRDKMTRYGYGQSDSTAVDSLDVLIDGDLNGSLFFNRKEEELLRIISEDALTISGPRYIRRREY